MRKFSAIAALVLIAASPALAQSNSGANSAANSDAKPSGTMAHDAKGGSMSMSMSHDKEKPGSMMMMAKPKNKNPNAMSNSTSNDAKPAGDGH
jgi:uncharacterized protein YdeI (BOF family)